jgi:hypothetical protein
MSSFTSLETAEALVTLTLTRQQWDTIRIATLCCAVDSSQSEPAWSKMATNAYNALRDAMQS